MRNPHDILIKPVITERSTGLMEENKYTFEVDPKANKIEIKHAVEKVFKVNVITVTTMSVHGKLKRQGKTKGYTQNWKKAIVTIKAGQRLPIFEE
ncbi:MAG: 50S ribosomal protein L23 [Firmicutes bacterium HGW-Firmicutes-12]|jgi:large subunit ribosomal protein L23|nr:MAG: 50S ribosomal protein L23 [Firmicutes bacterium HGW-Firmicutes-12]